jgi:hypothetical protein
MQPQQHGMNIEHIIKPNLPKQKKNCSFSSPQKPEHNIISCFPIKFSLSQYLLQFGDLICHQEIVELPLLMDTDNNVVV